MAKRDTAVLHFTDWANTSNSKNGVKEFLIYVEEFVMFRIFAMDNVCCIRTTAHIYMKPNNLMPLLMRRALHDKLVCHLKVDKPYSNC